MPAHRKPDDQVQPRSRTELTVVEPHPLVDESEHPAAGDWVPEVVDAWDRFWGSTLITVIEGPDHFILRRLFAMRDLQIRAFERYVEKPYVDGSQGQPVVNPEFTTAMKLETAIGKLEDRLGLSPKARANLGIAIGHVQLTAAELNRRARAEAEGVTGGDGDDDDLAAQWRAAT